MDNLKHSTVVRRAGEATKAKYGRDHYVAMGKKGGNALKLKMGTSYFKKIRAIGVLKAKKKRIVDQLAEYLNGENGT